MEIVTTIVTLLIPGLLIYLLKDIFQKNIMEAVRAAKALQSPTTTEQLINNIWDLQFTWGARTIARAIREQLTVARKVISIFSLFTLNLLIDVTPLGVVALIYFLMLYWYGRHIIDTGVSETLSGILSAK